MLAEPRGRDGARLHAVTGGNPSSSPRRWTRPASRSRPPCATPCWPGRAGSEPAPAPCSTWWRWCPTAPTVALLRAPSPLPTPRGLDDGVARGSSSSTARRPVPARAGAPRGRGRRPGGARRRHCTRWSCGARARDGVDPARLSFHAEAAADPAAVLRYAPAAAARAAASRRAPGGGRAPRAGGCGTPRGRTGRAARAAVGARRRRRVATAAASWATPLEAVRAGRGSCGGEAGDVDRARRRVLARRAHMLWNAGRDAEAHGRRAGRGRSCWSRCRPAGRSRRRTRRSPRC